MIKAWLLITVVKRKSKKGKIEKRRMFRYDIKKLVLKLHEYHFNIFH